MPTLRDSRVRNITPKNRAAKKLMRKLLKKHFHVLPLNRLICALGRVTEHTPGMDCHSLAPPIDSANYAGWQRIRAIVGAFCTCRYLSFVAICRELSRRQFSARRHRVPFERYHGKHRISQPVPFPAYFASRFRRMSSIHLRARIYRGSRASWPVWRRGYGSLCSSMLA